MITGYSFASDCFDRDYPAYDRQRILRSDRYRDQSDGRNHGRHSGVYRDSFYPVYIQKETTKSVDTVQERRG